MGIKCMIVGLGSGFGRALALCITRTGRNLIRATGKTTNTTAQARNSLRAARFSTMGIISKERPIRKVLSMTNMATRNMKVNFSSFEKINIIGESPFTKGHYHGTSYYENGNIEYEGSWKNNEWSGRGKLYHKNGLFAMVDPLSVISSMGLGTNMTTPVNSCSNAFGKITR
jgi:hypothetical protein